MLMSFFRSWTRRGERKAQPICKYATPSKKKPTIRLSLEALEDRLVPTVVFTPQFGSETYTGSHNGMQDPPVHLIFSGPYWNTAQGQQNEQTIIASTKNIVGGPYLSGLKQYGSDGKATYANSWNASSTVAGNPTTTALQSFLQNEIDLNPAGQPDLLADSQHAPIYVVLSDPTSSGAGQNGGYNASGTYDRYIFAANVHMIWVGTGKFAGETNAQWKDILTSAISHELAETISDPSLPGNITPGNRLPAGIGASAVPQIGDFEPEGSGGSKYGYRLNGDLMQPYWSQNDKAFIVPDGNTQNFYLQPIWSSNTFNGQYNLSVSGDQRGTNYNDQIAIGQTASGPQAGGVAVNLNAETAAFDPGTIQAINVNTFGGTNQVNVAAVPAGVALNITSFSFNVSSPSTDTVTVGSNSSLANIAGTVNVSNSSGQTHLIVSDGLDSVGRSVGVTNNAVTFAGLAGVNYTGASTGVSGSTVGVTSVEVDGGHGGNTFTVYSTAANTPLTLGTGTQSFGVGGNTVYIEGSSSAVTVNSPANDNVVVGNSGSLAGIGGPVTISNVSGHDALTIDDSNDSRARSIDITKNAVNFAATVSEPAVTINYTPAQILSNGAVAGVAQLTLFDARAANQIEVDSVGPNTATTIYGDVQDRQTGIASAQVRVFYRT